MALRTDAIGELAGLAEEKPLEFSAINRDGYGRIVAVCRAGDIELNAHMVRVGLEWAFPPNGED